MRRRLVVAGDPLFGKGVREILAMLTASYL